MVHIPDVLLPLILPNAHNFYYVINPKGQASFVYLLKVPFPASSVLADLDRTLSQKGFHRLKNCFLTHTRLSWSWEKVKMAQVPLKTFPKTWNKAPVKILTGFQWKGQWQNNQGDIVEITLSYLVPLGQQLDLRTLEVFVVFFPATYVCSLQQSTILQ